MNRAEIIGDIQVSCVEYNIESVLGSIPSIQVVHVIMIFMICIFQIVNGYFVHFFAPPDLPQVPKNVVFVIDRSGSMHGIKLKQVREKQCV